jgi:hypothetical protein
MTPNNPLSQYFRQPSIYIKLPSGGQFYPPGALDMPINGELPVLPMTAIDEITYRTPDALFNGQAVVSVIESCVPSIRNAWHIPSMDIDTVLTAIRIASYGHNMEFETKCTHCGADSTRTIDLRSILDRIKTPDYNKTIASGDVEIIFRPMSYKNLNDNNLMQFEEQKLLSILPNAEMSEAEKGQRLAEALKKITDITVVALAQSIQAIRTPGSLVTEGEYIVDFLKNCDRKLFNKIRDHIVQTKAQGEIPPLTINCDECKKDYEQIMTLDLSNFFEQDS